MLISYN